jgi:glucose dehydrogenase
MALAPEGSSEHNPVDIKKREEIMTSHRYRKSSAAGLACLLLAGTSALAQQAADPTRNLTPVTDAMLRNPPAADWLMWRRTYDGYGYSPLDQIRTSRSPGPGR